MRGENTPSFDHNDDIEELLASVRATFKRPSESTVSQPETLVPVNREIAERKQAAWNRAEHYPNPRGLPMGRVVEVMLAEEATREAKALAEPFVPYVPSPGAVSQKMEDYRERGLL